MLKIIIELIGLIIISIGVIAIYDARSISQKFFSSTDKNNSVKILRIVGFIVTLIGTCIIYIRYLV